jgi:hypothetical protein
MRGQSLDRCRIFSEQTWCQYVLDYLANTALRFSAVVRDNPDFTKTFPSLIVADSD